MSTIAVDLTGDLKVAIFLNLTQVPYEKKNPLIFEKNQRIKENCFEPSAKGGQFSNVKGLHDSQGGTPSGSFQPNSHIEAGEIEFMKKFQTIIASLVAGVMFAGAAVAPVTANAQSLKDLQNRQKHKNDWRNLTIAAGALGLWGLLKGDNTLMFAGAAGALYSASRYESDRKSQSKAERARAQMFSKRSFTRDGYVYNRKTVKKNGKTYYQFVRGKKARR